MLFSDLIGNKPAKHFLQKIIKDNLVANTLLFYGPDGIGKSLFAKEIAQALMYPKGELVAKPRIENETHPDLHVYRPEGKTAMHSIAMIRDLIDNVSMQPFEAKAKVFIIHDAERMLVTSSNALLKTLEEPTLDSYIILLTSHSEDLLPTILSRCMKIGFTALSQKEIKTHLEQKFHQSTQDANQIATLAEGSLAIAYSIATNQHYHERRKQLVNILAHLDDTAYLMMEKLIKLDSLYPIAEEDHVIWYKEIDLLFSQILMWFRDLFALKNGAETSGLYFADYLPLLQSQNLMSLPSLEKLQQLVEQTRLGIGRNIKLKNCLEACFTELMHFSRPAELSSQH